MTKESDLQDIAHILRKDALLMTTASKSGHPTSCSSAAEIVATLFFDTMKYDTKNPNNLDNDEFILSKGHAAPILYAALERAGCIDEDLLSLRKLNSPLEGHPMPRSLEWIKVASGSLGQGLSIGVGMSLAAKLQKRTCKTYVLLGDSEIAEGSVYEACELAAYYKLNNLVAIVDINRLGQRGETMLGHNINAYKKRFTGFGFNVLTCDGHNIKDLKETLKKANKSKQPTVILAKTYKGKFFKGIENEEAWHGKAIKKEQLAEILEQMVIPKMPSFKIKKPRKKINKQTNKKPKEISYKKGEVIATREAYGNTLAQLGYASNNVIALDAEVSNSTYANKIKQTTKHQFIECFIAEQNMIGVALGLQKKGYKTYASSFAAFLSRAHDQIRMAALSNPSGMTICGSHAGVSIGEDGASQMGLEDIALFRSLPNTTVLYPSDAFSTQKLMFKSKDTNQGITYIRTTRGKTPIIYNKKDTFPIGDFKVVKQSKQDNVVIAAAGITLHEALKAYNKQNTKNIAIVDIYSIQPFNQKKFQTFIEKHGKKLIIVEDHYKAGGIGEMITSKLTNTNIKVKHLYIKEIPHSGTPQELLHKYKIDSQAIIQAIKKI